MPVVGSGVGAGILVPWAMLPEVVELDEARLLLGASSIFLDVILSELCVLYPHVIAGSVASEARRPVLLSVWCAAAIGRRRRTVCVVMGARKVRLC